MHGIEEQENDMGLYIDRKQALSHPFANGKYDHEHANEHFILGFESYREWLEGLPTIDLVTCGECKYYAESEHIKGDMVCKYHLRHTYYTEADRFCYHGERRAK